MIKISFSVSFINCSLLCVGIHQQAAGEPSEIRPLSAHEIVVGRTFNLCEIYAERRPSSGGGTGSCSLLPSQRAQRVSLLDRYL